MGRTRRPVWPSLAHRTRLAACQSHLADGTPGRTLGGDRAQGIAPGIAGLQPATRLDDPGRTPGRGAALPTLPGAVLAAQPRCLSGFAPGCCPSRSRAGADGPVGTPGPLPAAQTQAGTLR